MGPQQWAMPMRFMPYFKDDDRKSKARICNNKSMIDKASPAIDGGRSKANSGWRYERPRYHSHLFFLHR
jgi:hypothetical protein